MSLLKPYYERDGITIYHGDCRDILSHLPPVDLVLTDPPYGVGMRAFDDDFAVGAAGFASSPGLLAAVFMWPRYVVEFANRADTWKFERLLWMHKVADIAAPWRGWSMNSDAIMIFSRHGAVWPKPEDYRSDVYTVGPWEINGHPNGKPISVVRDLLRRLSKENNLILDLFMGSGTTLRAAKDLGRCAIGIEIEERYCEIAAKRLAQEVLPWPRTG